MKRAMVRLGFLAMVLGALALASDARAAAPYGRYIPAAGLSGWVQDTATGLKWEVTASSATYMWCCTTPTSWCSTRAVGARVPTKKELESLVDVNATYPAIDTATFGSAVITLVSSTQASGSSSYWALNLADGSMGLISNSSQASVRCVQ